MNNGRLPLIASLVLMLFTFPSIAAEPARGRSTSGEMASGALNGQRYRVFISTENPSNK